MNNHQKFYINGQWVNPNQVNSFDVINPANEEVCATISLGTQADVDAAVTAAHHAFSSFGKSTRKERIEIFEAIVNEYKNRYDDMVEAITLEMGAPTTLAKTAQAAMGLSHLETALTVLKAFKFEEKIAVAGFIKNPLAFVA